MSAVQFFLPHLTATVAGIAQPGAQFEFLQTGTTTPLSVYSDEALSVPRTNPVVCNGVGALPTTYLDNTKTYRLRIYDKNDALIDGGDIDPYIPGTIPDASVLQPYVDACEDAAVEAAEAAGDASEALTALLAASVVTGASISVANRTILAALDHSAGLPAYLSEAGREGMFVWDSSNLSAKVTLDPRQGVYVAPASDTDGSSGAWVRRFSGAVNIRWFGAVGDNAVTDDYAAIQAAIDFLSYEGGKIEVPSGNSFGDYRLSARLVWHSPIELIGSTISQDARGTLGNLGPTFTFDAGVGGIFVKYNNDSDASGSPVIYSGGTGSLIQGIKLYSLSLSTPAAGKYGIESRGRITIRDCIVRGFGDTGIQIHGSQSGGDGVVFGNVNGSFVENTDCLFNAGDGAKISGNDGNVVTLIRCLFQENLGWAVTDDSFIGLLGIGCTFEGNDLGTVQQLRSSSPSLWLGCETEGGAISLGASASAIGGGFGQAAYAATGGAGFFMNAGVAQGAPYRFLNTINATTIGSQLGSNSVEANPSALAFGQENGSVYREWKLALFPSLNRWGFWYGNSAATTPIQFPDGTNSTGRAYAPEFPQGFCPGDESRVVTRLIRYGDAAPVAGTWVLGDLVLNKAPSANGVYAWRCTVAGTPGTWEAVLGVGTALALTGAITSSGGKIGYAVGAGGSVTQATSKATGVTLNKLCGQITLHNASLAANTAVGFTLTNSQIGADDNVRVWVKSGNAAPGSYRVDAESNAAGSRTIIVENKTAGALAEAIVLGFTVGGAVIT